MLENLQIAKNYKEAKKQKQQLKKNKQTDQREKILNVISIKNRAQS